MNALSTVIVTVSLIIIFIGGIGLYAAIEMKTSNSMNKDDALQSCGRACQYAGEECFEDCSSLPVVQQACGNTCKNSMEHCLTGCRLEFN